MKSPIKLHHDVTAKFTFQVKSADEPKAEAPAERAGRKNRPFLEKHTK